MSSTARGQMSAPRLRRIRRSTPFRSPAAPPPAQSRRSVRAVFKKVSLELGAKIQTSFSPMRISTPRSPAACVHHSQTVPIPLPRVRARARVKGQRLCRQACSPHSPSANQKRQRDPVKRYHSRPNRQHIGNQINAAFIFARAVFKNVCVPAFALAHLITACHKPRCF